MANEDAVKMCSTKYLVSEMSMDLKTDELTDNQQYLLLDGSHPMKKDIGLFYFNNHPAAINDSSIMNNQLFPYAAVTRAEYPDMIINQDSEFSALGDSGQTNNAFFVYYCKSLDDFNVTVNGAELSKYGLSYNILKGGISDDSSIGYYSFDLYIKVIDSSKVKDMIFKPNIKEDDISVPFKLCGIGLNGYIVCHDFNITFNNTLYEETGTTNPRGIITFNNTKETIATGTDNTIYFTYMNIAKSTISIDMGASTSDFTSTLHIDDNSTDESGNGYLSLSTSKTEFADFNIKISGKELYYTNYVNDTVLISLN